MEVFHEDILETFLFSLIVCFGILQIIGGRRGWRGLCIYGRRMYPQVNNAIGAACLIFGYAWYFTNPDHMNTRNIEGFMSILCMALGAVAAFSANVILSSLAGWISRRYRKRKWNRAARGGKGRLQERSLAKVSATYYFPSAEMAEGPLFVRRLVVTDQEGLTEELLDLLLRGAGKKEVAVLEPDYDVLLGVNGGGPRDFRSFLATSLEEISGTVGMIDERVEVVGLGAGANLLLAGGEVLGRRFPRCRGVAIYPLGCEDGLVEDALKENTVAETVRAALGRGIKISIIRKFFKMWLLLLVFSMALSLGVAFAFDIRWKALSGTVIGFALSLYLLFLYLEVKHPHLLGGSRERAMIALLEESVAAGSEDHLPPITLMAPPNSAAIRAFRRDETPGDTTLDEMERNRLEVVFVQGTRSGFLSHPWVIASLAGGVREEG